MMNCRLPGAVKSLLPLGALLLAACGSGDAPSEALPFEPLMAQIQGIDVDPQATTAEALVPPETSDVPVVAVVPPATLDASTLSADGAGTGGAGVGSELVLVLPSIMRQTVAAGLSAPTDLAFTNDGNLFYTDRLQGLYILRPGRPALLLFAPQELSFSSSSRGRGLLAVAVDPEFSRNRYVYVFMRSALDGRDRSRIVRLQLDSAYAKVIGLRDILVIDDDQPSDAEERDAAHPGGGMRFGPDGYLFVGLGDGRVPTAAQSSRALSGKVLRIDRDGEPAPGNRPSAGHDERVYAHGMRDPVALAFHPNTETLLVAQRRGLWPDDLTWVRNGMNAGWDARCQTNVSGYCEPPIEAMMAMAVGRGGWRGGRAGEGVAAVARLRGPSWGEWRNAFIVAFDNAQRLDLVKFDARGHVVQAAPVLQKLGVGFKALAQGPDAVYVVTSGKSRGEEIWRLVPQ